MASKFNIDDDMPAAKTIVPPQSLTDGKVVIQIEDNENIPPGGQFVGVNGYGYLIKTGMEIPVPVGVCDVLDNAVEIVAVKNPDTLQIVSYRTRKRFPYRIISGHDVLKAHRGRRAA
jgi:hypothetical protein